MKTSELEGAALDRAVSVAKENSKPFPIWTDGKPQCLAAYSMDWAQSGPIIEREVIALEPMTHDEHGYGWLATRGEGSNIYMEFGSTPLIAAMRCYVASKLGDEVTIPEV